MKLVYEPSLYEARIRGSHYFSASFSASLVYDEWLVCGPYTRFAHRGLAVLAHKYGVLDMSVCQRRGFDNVDYQTGVRPHVYM